MKIRLLKRAFIRPSFFVPKYTICIIALCLALPINSKAQHSEYITSLINRATEQESSQKEKWHKLLHYKKNKTNVKSEIISPDFFLDENGRINSQAELIATIKYLFDTKNDQQNICRFPARFRWLKKELNINKSTHYNLDNCEEYNEWAKNGDIKSVSLVFASGHLSNPASFYGHILLKFNTDADNDNNLLDSSLNYGAITPENENPIIYIIKGLAGGYESAFTNQIFYRHNHKYAENELRDLWSYQLNLSDEQIQQLTDHSWELLGKNFTYYFLKQNCGYRMAELLNLVIDERLLPQMKQWAMPSDILQKITNINNGDKPLIKNIKRIKSRQNDFREKFVELSIIERKTVEEFISINSAENIFHIDQLSDQENKRIIDTLFDYYAFILTKDNVDKADIELRRQSLIIDRLQLDTKKVLWANNLTVHSPDESQNSTMIQLSPVYNDRLGEGIDLRFRAAYYDYLSVNNGRAPFTQMSMLDISTTYQENKLRLKELNLLNIETLNISPTGLSEDTDYAWKVKTGAKNLNLECVGCLYTYVLGGIGKGFSLNNESAIYGMITSEISAFGPESVQLKAGFTIGVITGYGDWWKTHIEAGLLESITSDHQLNKFISWENRFLNSKTHDIRLKITYNEATEIKFSTSYYW